MIITLTVVFTVFTFRQKKKKRENIQKYWYKKTKQRAKEYLKNKLQLPNWEIKNINLIKQQKKEELSHVEIEIEKSRLAQKRFWLRCQIDFSVQPKKGSSFTQKKKDDLEVFLTNCSSNNLEVKEAIRKLTKSQEKEKTDDEWAWNPQE